MVLTFILAGIVLWALATYSRSLAIWFFWIAFPALGIVVALNTEEVRRDSLRQPDDFRDK